MATWESLASDQLVIQPNDAIVIAGDSISSGGYHTWQANLSTYLLSRYGSAACPVTTTVAQSGANIANFQALKLSTVIAANPTVVIVELGANELSADSAAGTQASAEALVDALRASLPNVRIAWLNVFMGLSEVWNPDPNAHKVSSVNNGLSAMCRSRSVKFIDVHGPAMLREAAVNTPSPGVASGILTVDGLHPNLFGNPLMDASLRTQLYLSGSVNPVVTSSFTPSTAGTVALWLRADTIAGSDGDLLSTWSDESGNAKDFTASGTARPMLKKVSTGLGYPIPAVRFDGTTSAMRSALSISGAKTVFVVYKQTGQPAAGDFFSALTLTDGALDSEFIPTFNGGTSPNLMFMNDMKRSGSDGFYNVGSTDVLDDALHRNADLMRFSGVFNGGSSTDPGSYGLSVIGSPLSLVQQSGFISRTATDPCSLGARLTSADVGSKFTPMDVSEVLVYSGALSAFNIARVDQYLRAKWGPA